MSIRLWMEGPEGKAEVWNSFARCFGGDAGRAEIHRFETLLASLYTYARRPLVRHGLACMCIGSDEAILQTLVREAARGDLPEAAMIASLIVPARHAEPVALMAAPVGQAMQRISKRTPIQRPERTGSEERILH
ncbi:hypothetical protein [Roseivivax sp. THAF40]|nr:hypothetical protein [Roseivivax sp. THAF40]